jgi:nitroreductase
VGEIELYEAMRTLRAVRRLRPDPIPDAVLRRALEAATFAPTGGNAQPWRALVVRERALVARLGALYAERWAAYAAGHRKLWAKAPAEIVARAERMMAAGDFLAAHFAETPAVVVFCFDPTFMAITDAKLPRVSVVGGASVYPAVQNFLLACRAEGLGCVLTTLLCEVEPEVRELLAIPEPWGTACAVPVGWPRARGHGPLSRRPVERMAFADRFGEPLA